MLNLSRGGGGVEDAGRAFRALGMSATRSEILRTILSTDDVTTAELMVEFGMTRNGIIGHLKALSEERLVSDRRTTHPRGSGPITYWKADRVEVEMAFIAVAEYVTGDFGRFAASDFPATS